MKLAFIDKFLLFATGLLSLCNSAVGNEIINPAPIASWKHSVADVGSLPGSGNTAGDARVVVTPISIYLWDGFAWNNVTGGGGSTVTSLNSLTGALNITGTANQTTITPSGANINISLPQDIATTSDPTFDSVTATNNGFTSGHGGPILMLNAAQDSSFEILTDHLTASYNFYIPPTGSGIGNFMFDSDGAGNMQWTTNITTDGFGMTMDTLNVANALNIFNSSSIYFHDVGGDIVTVGVPNPSSTYTFNLPDTPSGVPGSFLYDYDGAATNKYDQRILTDGAGNVSMQTLAMTAGDITLFQNPTQLMSAANKLYVDSVVNGLSWKTAVVAATTAALPAVVYNNGASGVGATLTGVSFGVLTIDGISMTGSERVLIKNQVSGFQNGIYTVTQKGTIAQVFILTRATDNDTAAEMTAAAALVDPGGAVNQNKGFQQNVSSVTIGTTNLVWSPFLSTVYTASGLGITLSGTTFSLQLDGSTLSQSASGVKVATGAINNNEIGGSAAIARTKIANGTSYVILANDASGVMSENAALTGNRAVGTDANGQLKSSGTTFAELAFVSGVTSALQTQLNSKAAISGQTFTGAIGFAQATLTDAATITWNLATQQAAKVTLGGNRTLQNPSNQVAGFSYSVLVVQDGTGSRTLSYGTNYKWPSGGAPVLTTTAGAVDLLTFTSDGTNMYGAILRNFQ